MRRFFPTIIFAACFTLIVSIAVFPFDDADALTFGPVKFVLQADPAQTIKEKIFLLNETDKPLELKSRIQNVTFGPDDRGVPIPAGIEGELSLAQWISLSEDIVSVAPRERKEVMLTINVPTTALPGGYYAQVLWSPTQSPGPGVTAIGETGPLVLLRVDGPVQEDASVIYFGTENGRTQIEKLPATFITKVQNNGSSHIIPQGYLKIIDARGRSVAQYELNAGKEASAILPGGNIRRLDTVWDNSGIVFGDYTAVMYLTYGEGNSKSLNAEFAFRVIPIAIIAIWLLIAAILILLCVRLIKNALPIKDKKRV